MQSLLNNLENGIKQMIDAAATGIDTALGQTNSGQTDVTVYARQGDERPIGSGNFLTTVEVTLTTNADNTSIEEQRERCDEIFAVLMAEDFAATLSTVSDVHVFGIINRVASHGVENELWSSMLTFDCYACLRDLTT